MGESSGQNDHEGHLSRRGNSGRWHRRYFMLRRGILVYYHSEGEKKVAGRMTLDPSTVIRESPDSHGAATFTVVSGAKAMYLCADGPASMREWIDKLRQSIAEDTVKTTTLSRPLHKFTIKGTTFEVDTKYQLIKEVGHGAYGVVVAAKDISKNKKVAIKKITKTFDDLEDAKRIVREIRLLIHLSHPNIIGIYDILPPPTLNKFEDVYILTDLMETDLHRVIYSRQPLTDDHVQYFLYQLLCALQYLHSAEVLHRDLKPSNILLNSNCDLKLCDFGLARGVAPAKGAVGGGSEGGGG